MSKLLDWALKNVTKWPGRLSQVSKLYAKDGYGWIKDDNGDYYLSSLSSPEALVYDTWADAKNNMCSKTDIIHAVFAELVKKDADVTVHHVMAVLDAVGEVCDLEVKK